MKKGHNIMLDKNNKKESEQVTIGVLSWLLIGIISLFEFIVIF